MYEQKYKNPQSVNHAKMDSPRDGHLKEPSSLECARLGTSNWNGVDELGTVSMKVKISFSFFALSFKQLVVVNHCYIFRNLQCWALSGSTLQPKWAGAFRLLLLVASLFCEKVISTFN